MKAHNGKSLKAILISIDTDPIDSMGRKPWSGRTPLLFSSPIIVTVMPNLTTSEFVSFLSMLVALAAVIVGPIVTFKVAKRQIISPIRQKWIDELRELMSQYLSECRKAIIISEGKGLLDTDQTDEALFQKLLYLEQKLELMLNTKENDHINLIKKAGEITDEVHHGVSDIIKFGEKIGAATRLCQKILKSEWERVKNGAM